MSGLRTREEGARETKTICDSQTHRSFRVGFEKFFNQIKLGQSWYVLKNVYIGGAFLKIEDD